MSKFDEYIVYGEPGQRVKVDAWQTAIGIQNVDGLKASPYLLDSVRQHIKGDITIDEARERITPRFPKSQFDALDCLWIEFAQNRSPNTTYKTDKDASLSLFPYRITKEKQREPYFFTI